MIVDVLIVTHFKDKAWLDLCLKSIGKFLSGFNEVVVLVPQHELRGFHDVKVRVTPFDQAPDPKGHLHHCIQKCRADIWCGADYILFLDADCLFREPTSVSDYFVDGKPVLLMESYASMQKEGNPAVCWLPGTTDVLGFMPTHEFMRRHPAVHCRELFSAFRSHVEKVHQQPFEPYALSRRHENPCGFNDFNNLGAFAKHYMPERYYFIDLTNAPFMRPRDHLIQYWSHRRPDEMQERWLDGQKKNVCPLAEIRRLLA